MMGIVYHANYLLYFEDARTAFLAEVGCPYEKIEQAGFQSPVVHFECSYGSPLHYGDVARVRTRVIEVRPVKTVYAYEVFKQGQNMDVDQPCCTGKSTHCLVDSETFKPVNMKKATPWLYDRYLEVVEPDICS